MAESQSKIGILPYGQRLGMRPARLPLSKLQWPLGMPTPTEGKNLSDLLPIDHMLVTPHSSLYFRPSFGTKARVSVMLLEPRAVHHRHLNMLRLFHRRFHRILTADKELLSVPNSIFFPVGGSWVPNHGDIDLSKSAMCSLIASAKNRQPGHKLRHEMVRWIRDNGKFVDIMGRGYHPFLEKSDGLASYRYSIVIENAREPNYFSEKLIDALLCKTVPIYWGCPNTAEFFDTSGMILCEDMADIQRAVENMSEADYQSRLPALAENCESAVGYMDFYERAAKLLLKEG